MDNKEKEEDNIGSFYMGRTRRPPQPKRQLPTGMLTTLVVFALAGIIWYAYPRGAEKYTDMDVPVIQADTAPLKEQPENPGGMEVPHQDSTVFDPLAKTPTDAVEKLTPTPEEPMDKAEALQPEAAKVAPPVTAKMEPKLDLDLQMKDAETGTEKVVAKPEAEPKPAAVTPPKEVKKAEVKKAAPAKTETGTAYIQLGSYRDTESAKKDWERLKKKHAEYLGKLSMKTEKADIPAKGIYYRLYAGKLTEARAKEICTTLKKANPGGCIVSRH